MDFNKLFIYIICIIPITIQAQHKLSGKVVDVNTQKPLPFITVLDKTSGKESKTNSNGFFELSNLAAGQHELVIYNDPYIWKEKSIIIYSDTNLIITIREKQELNEVLIKARRKEVFDLKRLKDVEGTAIYAGKKNEVILINQILGNKASNNARQVYAQVSGLNIYESTNCGLQLAIGGRGLDPNRTSNFNTRQNNYDISADVLGYPESYYTPPVEALKEIQIIRGAASLQYGTQFGGLINYKLKNPSIKPLEFVTRQTYDTNCGYTTFNSLSSTNGKFSHYTYITYKNNLSEAPRLNMDLESVNFYTNLNFQFSKKIKLGLQYTHLNYIAQQAGGLTDAQFYKDPTFTNRTRNWFRVNWNLFALKFNHQFKENKQLDINLFGLHASRKAIGFRTNRVSQNDDVNEPRDLQVGNFRNWGTEIRYLTNYTLRNKKSTLLLGGKYYQAYNSERQGPGTTDNDANFSFVDYANEDLPVDLRQSDFNFPNLNFALFSENIFYINDKLSITPGVRFEYIKTETEGLFRSVDRDLANNIIRDNTFEDNRTLNRNQLLLGLGVSYKPNSFINTYGNISQNYRSVTFTDIRVINPSFQVDPNISDEKGFTANLGLRGRYKKIFSYDANAFGLLYDDRIGEVLRAETRINANGKAIETGRIVRFRGNIGRAFIYGLESLVDWNIRETFFEEYKSYKLNYYTNLAITQSKYLESEIPGVENNKVEFVPDLNLRTGLKLGYKNYLADIQFSYMGKQFTDASNAPQDITDNQNGIIGTIPAYAIWDFSFSFRYMKWRLETGVNNVLNQSYFTQRATGYPGPGIIPALPRSFYITFQLKL